MFNQAEHQNIENFADEKMLEEKSKKFWSKNLEMPPEPLGDPYDKLWANSKLKWSSITTYKQVC